MGKKGSSTARKQRRGKVDQFSRPIPKRLYNNKKRTKGRQKQEVVKKHYHEMLERLKYIKGLIKQMVEEGEKLTDDNWIKVVRKYDDHKLIFDDYEKQLMFRYVR